MEIFRRGAEKSQLPRIRFERYRCAGVDEDPWIFFFVYLPEFECAVLIERCEHTTIRAVGQISNPGGVGFRPPQLDLRAWVPEKYLPKFSTIFNKAPARSQPAAIRAEGDTRHRASVRAQHTVWALQEQEKSDASCQYSTQQQSAKKQVARFLQKASESGLRHVRSLHQCS